MALLSPTNLTAAAINASDASTSHAAPAVTTLQQRHELPLASFSPGSPSSSGSLAYLIMNAVVSGGNGIFLLALGLGSLIFAFRNSASASADASSCQRAR